MDFMTIAGIVEVLGVVVGQISHMVKKGRELKKNSDSSVGDGEILHSLLVKRPMNTLTAIGMALGGALATLPDSGNPFMDFLNAFVIGYGADSLINRSGDARVE
mgnify:CR=1 FL=1